VECTAISTLPSVSVAPASNRAFTRASNGARSVATEKACCSLDSTVAMVEPMQCRSYSAAADKLRRAAALTLAAVSPHTALWTFQCAFCAAALWYHTPLHRAHCLAPFTRGLHSSTFQLNLSALHGVGGARRGCVARVRGV